MFATRVAIPATLGVLFGLLPQSVWARGGAPPPANYLGGMMSRSQRAGSNPRFTNDGGFGRSIRRARRHIRNEWRIRVKPSAIRFRLRSGRRLLHQRSSAYRRSVNEKRIYTPSAGRMLVRDPPRRSSYLWYKRGRSKEPWRSEIDNDWTRSKHRASDDRANDRDNDRLSTKPNSRRRSFVQARLLRLRRFEGRRLQIFRSGGDKKGGGLADLWNRPATRRSFEGKVSGRGWLSRGRRSSSSRGMTVASRNRITTTRSTTTPTRLARGRWIVMGQ